MSSAAKAAAVKGNNSGFPFISPDWRVSKAIGRLETGKFMHVLSLSAIILFNEAVMGLESSNFFGYSSEIGETLPATRDGTG